MSFLATAALLAATLTTGLMAGLFAAFSYAVMPGLHRGDDRTFVSAMQQVNRAIVNGWFLTCFLGALVTSALATALLWTEERRDALPFALAGLVLYLAVLVITGAINVPLNNRLDRAGAPETLTDPASVRADFEAGWVRWNHVRTLASTAAFATLLGALLTHGRALG